MKVEIKKATLRDLTYIAAHMREIDKEEILASGPETTWDAAIVTHYATEQLGGVAYTVWADDNPEVAFGMMPGGDMNPWVLNAWLWGTNKTTVLMPAVMRWGRKNWIPTALALKATRIEARSHENHHEAHAWLERMGCRRECVLTDWGRDRTRFVLFAWHLEMLDGGQPDVHGRKQIGATAATGSTAADTR